MDRSTVDLTHMDGKVGRARTLTHTQLNYVARCLDMLDDGALRRLLDVVLVGRTVVVHGSEQHAKDIIRCGPAPRIRACPAYTGPPRIYGPAHVLVTCG